VYERFFGITRPLSTKKCNIRLEAFSPNVIEYGFTGCKLNIVNVLDHVERKVPKIRITQNKGKERENSYQKLKRSLEERHTLTHGNLIEIF
jgi:hypothetical protein